MRHPVETLCEMRDGAAQQIRRTNICGHNSADDQQKAAKDALPAFDACITIADIYNEEGKKYCRRQQPQNPEARRIAAYQAQEQEQERIALTER